MFDVLTGSATIDILNELAPDSDWSLYSDEDEAADEQEDIPDYGLGKC